MHVRSWMCVASTFTQQYTELKERGELWFYFLLSHGWQRRRGQVGGGSKRGATNRLVAALCLAHPHACSDFILYPRSLLSLLARSLLSVFMVSLCCFGYSLVQCARFALLFFAVIPEPFQPRLHKSWDRVRERGADRQTKRIQRESQEGGWMWFKFWCQLNCIARGCWTNSFEG